MSLESEINQQMILLNRSRNRFNYLLQALVYAFSVYFQKTYLMTDLSAWTSLGIFTFGALSRGFSTEVLFLKHPRAFRIVNVLGYSMMALGWCLHFYSVLHHYGDPSQNVSHTMMILAGIFVITAQALTSSKESFFAFVPTLGFGGALVFLTDGNSGNDYVGWGIMAFTLVYGRIFSISHNQIRRTIELQILSDREQKRLQDLIDSVPAVIVIIDKDLHYRGANTFALTIFPNILSQKVGYTATEDYSQFIHSFMKSERTDDVKEIRLHLNDRVTHMMVNTHKVSDGGAVIVALIMDELVKVREELKEKEAKAQYSSKLASLGQMAAGIAHEVNNPLTIIQGSANIINRLVNETPIDVETVKDFSDKMLQTCKRISKTIHSLKSLSRNGENDPFTSVSVKMLLDDCMNVCLQRFKSFDVDVRLPALEKDFLVKGREVQLGQVLLNLLNNACDAIEKVPAPWLQVEVTAQEEWVFVDVIDSGAGISPGIRKKIMEPFFTTKEVNQGTGLGLSISKTIMDEHGGELLLLEGVKHTTFRMKIPLMKKQSLQAPA